MRKRSSAAIVLSLLTALTCAAPAFALQATTIPAFVGGVRPGAIWHDKGFFDAARACFDKHPFARFHERAQTLQSDCEVDYMKRHGASAQAIAFMRYAPVPAQIDQVRHGRAASVVYADMMWADAASGFALVGKSGEVVPLWTAPELDNDPDYATFKRHYPDAMLWGTSVGWPQVTPGRQGGDRFVVTFNARTCHACATIGKAVVAYDFDQRGKFDGVRLLKISPVPAPHQ
ncbi:MAG: hypothetical protein ACREQN_10130 [Candidatus Binataceae bacterium]